MLHKPTPFFTIVIPPCKVVDVRDLLPGDTFIVPQAGVTLCCDAVLLSGACVVNESMLTGAIEGGARSCMVSLVTSFLLASLA